MTESLGEYLSLSHLDNEIALTYWPSRYALQWSQCGKIPDFIAGYLATIENERGSHSAGNMRAMVSYVLNELVENSVKFYLAGTILVRVGRHENDIVLVVVNQISKDDKPELIKQFSDLLKSDPETVFMARMEENVHANDRDASSLGLLSMILDYHARLGWSFSPVAGNDDRIWLHTMVRVPYRTVEGN